MSSSNRKKKKRNQRIRVGIGLLAIIAAMYFFINAITTTLSYGLNVITGLYGLGIVLSFFFAGMIMSPELKKMQATYEKEKQQ